jgi:hypothetical protein
MPGEPKEVAVVKQISDKPILSTVAKAPANRQHVYA